MYICITTATFDPTKEAEIQQLADEKLIGEIPCLPFLKRPQTFPAFLANAHDAEAWIRHYEWEGAGGQGIVSPTRLTAPPAPSSALAFPDERLC